MLQGKATIRLTDPKTNLILYQETHKNTITPALQRLFKSDLAGTLDYNKAMPIITKLLGGVCLFNGTVNASDVFLPKATAATLTAHAGQHSGTGDNDPKRGSLNATQSGPVPGGYMWVWDWTTKGNGTITDVVLTHADTGDYWNESTPNVMDEFQPVGDLSSHNLPSTDFLYKFEGDYSDTPQIINQKRIPIGFYDDINNVVSLEIDYTNHRFNVYISKFTGSGAWLWNECGEPYDAAQPIPFNVSHYQWGEWQRLGRFMFGLAYNKATKKLYAFTIGRPEATSYQDSWFAKIIYVNELNLTTGSKTDYEIDLTNKLASDSFVGLWGHSPEGCPKLYKIVDGSIFVDVVSSNGTFTGNSLRINLSNHSDVELITGLGSVVGQNSNGFAGALDLGNDRIFYCDNFAAKDENGEYKGFTVDRDAANGSLFGPRSPNMRIFACEQFTASPVQYMTRLKNGEYESNNEPPRGCILNKLYAATVYHLEQPVTKTANITMTVEYTITEEIES